MNKMCRFLFLAASHIISIASQELRGLSILYAKTVVHTGSAEHETVVSYGRLQHSNAARKLSHIDFRDPKSVIFKEHTSLKCPWPPQPTLHNPIPIYREGYDKYYGDFRSRNAFYFHVTDFLSMPQTIDGSAQGGSDQFNSFQGVLPRIYVLKEGLLWIRELEGSAWNDLCAVIDSDSHFKWVAPDSEQNAKQVPDQMVDGDHIVFTSWQNNNYGHFLHDQLPMIAWLKENIDTNVKFLLPHYSLHKTVLNMIDSVFVAERVVWIELNQVVKVANGNLSVITSIIPNRNPRFMESLRQWLYKPSSNHGLPSLDRKTIIYYSRKSVGDTNGGRVFDANHESDIIAVIKRAMARHNRLEELVIFNGQENEKTMEIIKQRELFRSATAAIGPHGSGLSNVLWMDVKNPVQPPGSNGENQEDSCKKERPKVLEFILGPESGHVHPPCETCEYDIFSRTYYQLYATIPWLEYHHILYTANSTQEVPFISLLDLDSALDYMWDTSEGSIH